MQVMAVYVLVLEHYIRLTAVPHLLHIFPCNALQLGVCQTVIGMGVQRYMDNRFLGADMRRKIAAEILHRTSDVQLARAVVEDFVGGKQPSFLLVYLLPVVRQCTIK